MAAFRMGIPKRYPGDKRPKMVIERSVIFTPFIKKCEQDLKHKYNLLFMLVHVGVHPYCIFSLKWFNEAGHL